MSGSAARRDKAGQGRPAGKNDTLTRQFQTAEQHADATLAGWVGHPAVRGIIGRHKGEANAAVAPIARHLPRQKEAAAFCWGVYGLAGVGPDWEFRRGGAPFMLTEAEAWRMGFVIALFRHVVRVTVSELASAGVAVMPAWTGDHAAVGEMLLIDVPWDLPAVELAACLNPPGPGAITADASGTSLRRGTGERAETNLTAIRRQLEQHLHGPRRRAPYAGDGKRDDRRTTVNRREALAKVLERFPDTTPSKIVSTFSSYTRLTGGQAGSAGGYLRQLLQNAAWPGETVICPVRETLRQDLLALRAERGHEKDQVNLPEDSPGHTG